MAKDFARFQMARALRRAHEGLLEASEAACELQRFELSAELLEDAVKVLNLHKEALEIPSKAASTPDRLYQRSIA